MAVEGCRLLGIYRRLHEAYGPQHWWPGETPFEVIVGAILTQAAAWTNVEKAIANLKAAGAAPPGGPPPLRLPSHGIGPETADAILLYAAGRPVFVIDAYTRRLFSRLAVVPERDTYAAWQALFARSPEPDAPPFHEYHALIVRHGKERCR